MWGIALPLELVHLDILQRQADITTLPLIYQIQNTNNEELENTRILFIGRADGQAIIDQKAMENRRWARLYGSSGLLGFDERLCRTFYPDFNNDDPFPIPASFVLRREDSSDLKLAKGVVESVKLHSVEEWENYERFAINRAFEEINRLSEGVGKYYR